MSLRKDALGDFEEKAKTFDGSWLIPGDRTFQDESTVVNMGPYVLPPSFNVLIEEIDPDALPAADEWAYLLELGGLEHGVNAPLRLGVSESSWPVAALWERRFDRGRAVAQSHVPRRLAHP